MERPLENISKLKEIGYGIWKQMLQLSQSCQPNTTFVHFKSAFLLFSLKKISKGEKLTCDFFADVEAFKRSEIMKKKIGYICEIPNCACRI